MQTEDHIQRQLDQLSEFQKETRTDIKKISLESSETNILVKELKTGLISRIENIEKTGLQRFQTATETTRDVEERLADNIKDIERRLFRDIEDVKKKNDEQDKERLNMIKAGIKWIMTIFSGIFVAIIAGFVTLHLK